MKLKLNLYFAAILFLAGSSSAIAATQQELLNSVADGVVQAAQANYTKVVEKLTKDGTGASATSDSQKGFIPTQDSFMRGVSFDTIVKSKNISDDLFTIAYTPSSKQIITVTLKKDPLSKEEENLVIAKILDSLVGPIRTIYTKTVVFKLKKEGTGGSLDYLQKPGFVPLPAVFTRMVAVDASFKVSAILQRDVSIGLRSKWNLNRQQDLQDDFEREGWHALSAQQDDQLAAKKSLRRLKWQPFYKLENVNNKQQLRYLSADIATGRGCVACHNHLETTDSVKQLRQENNVAAGKVFELNELMGALSILVQVN